MMAAPGIFRNGTRLKEDDLPEPKDAKESLVPQPWQAI
jgi:hypothetical protein